ncbi:hypothetical protein BGZ94_005941 [Podila epigama]|nr:hypothetical protein BGZ94_005941 [Podila epigama]
MAMQHRLQPKSVPGLVYLTKSVLASSRVATTVVPPSSLRSYSRIHSRLSRGQDCALACSVSKRSTAHASSAASKPFSSSTPSSTSAPASGLPFSFPSTIPVAPKSEASSWHIPTTKEKGVYRSRPIKCGPLPLPIALKAFNPRPNNVPVPKNGNTSITKSKTKAQLVIPPSPAVIGSQPLYHLAKRFPIQAEKELNALPRKSALDYSSFLIGAMETSYPSATTLRAVVRQFRNFLKASTRNTHASASSTSASSTSSLPSHQQTQTRQHLQQHLQQPHLELPRARIWAQAIRSLIWLKQYRRARVAVHAMQNLGIKPTGYAWRGICRGWIEQGQLDRAEELAVKVFLNPTLSHNYQMEERPYYLPEMQLSSSAASRVRQRHQSPVAPTSLPLFLVIEAFAERGEMERARHWFDQIPEHQLTDMLTSNMVAGYLRSGERDKAHEVIQIMARCGVKPTAIVFNPIVKHAVETMDMETAEDLVKDMVQRGVYLNLYTYKILIQGYMASGQKSKVLECIERMSKSGIETDRALGRVLLEGLWRLGEIREGDIGPASIASGDRPTKAAQGLAPELGWSVQCKAWIRAGNFEEAEEVLEQAFHNSKTSALDNEVVQVIRELVDNNDMTRAGYWYKRAMDQGQGDKDGNEASLIELSNCVVDGYIRAKQPEKAEAVIRTMMQHGVQPTVDTFNMLLDWTTLDSDMTSAETLVSQMTHSGLAPNKGTFEILCRGYVSHGQIESLAECVKVMEELGHVSKDGDDSAPITRLCLVLLGRDSHQTALAPKELSETLSNICQRLVEQGQVSRAEAFVNKIRSLDGIQSNQVPYETLIRGWIGLSQQHAVSTLAITSKSQEQGTGSTNTTGSNTQSSSPILSTPPSGSVPTSASLEQEKRWRQDSLAKIRKARSWFDKMPEEDKTVDMVNLMIGGYVALGLEDDFEALIQWMASKRIAPNVQTYNHILEYTVQKYPMSIGEELVREMRTKAKIAPNVDTWNLLIRGYVIRQQLAQALRCLDRMMGMDRLSTIPVIKNKYKNKAREMVEHYDRDILSAVVQDDVAEKEKEEVAEEEKEEEGKEKTERHSAKSQGLIEQGRETWAGFVEPNEATRLLILSGFGPESNPVQGQGDYSRALELYRSRVARQKEQEKQLLEGMLMWRDEAGEVSKEEEKEEEEVKEEWIRSRIQLWEGLGESGSELGKTDMAWKHELEWEEMMERERERGRELMGVVNANVPVLALQLKAELENITELIPADADHTWHFKIQCTGCREVNDNWITVNAVDKAELSSGRGEANLVMKCKFCKRESSADFASKPVPYNIENNDKFATIVTIECRGLEPVGFEPRVGWNAKGAESGTPFEDIDLSDGDWADYDEKSELPVAISNIEAKFVKVK